MLNLYSLKFANAELQKIIVFHSDAVGGGIWSSIKLVDRDNT
ncbi:hypothetical protein [Scytonema millei]|uniref:Uncharacterized protein n=1 Tax=Scytonema tolypothrichoides VB-61278_2 TaxID=3232314 RepID=A0ABW8WV91_9CYAN